MSRIKLILIVLLITCILSVVTLYSILGNSQYYKKYISLKSNICNKLVFEKPEDFNGFNNVTGEPNGCKIVPNYVHFVKFGQVEFNFPHTVCILSALKNQNPDKIFFHTDVLQFKGKYWDLLLATPGFKEKLVINRISLPKEIFGQPLNKNWLRYHGGDVTRLRVLLQYGGIYLDNDSFIVRSLDFFRRFEMSLGWKPGKSLGNMVIVAHKNARFLHEWLESYRRNYYPKRFYYNAGEYPAQHILMKKPYLIHREEKVFGNYGPFKDLYLKPFPQWREYYAIHTQSNHLYQLKKLSKDLKYPVLFNEHNILNYPVAYRDLVRSVFPLDAYENNKTLFF
ncbi:uncharacterized protein LOC142328967 [Lycorma delicatula]|uniref:uncharacterized protein LOC142328967 n=1 Tax=Lycorma delicatula TaxID=130591 RepID=UPI003F51716D